MSLTFLLIAAILFIAMCERLDRHERKRLERIEAVRRAMPEGTHTYWRH